MSELPEHLGGHLNRVHTDRSTLVYLKNKYNIKSMLDVGCGPGDMVQIARDKGLIAKGIDGDYTLRGDWSDKSVDVLLHDFTEGVPNVGEYDLCWSVEFLEHVYEEFLPNIMETYKKCNYVVCTAAPPGWDGHHHVNCQPQEYWVEKFSEYGFTLNEEDTAYIRENSAMRKPFMQRTGMVYVRND